MSAGPRRSGRIAAAAAAAIVAASAAAAMPASQAHDDAIAFTLSTNPSKQTREAEARYAREYSQFPIDDDDWVMFFCYYLDNIQNNIGVYLTKINSLRHLTEADLYKLNLSSGGFDSEFDNLSMLYFNIGLYEALFTQFKDGTNKINNCERLNQLISYLGSAMLRMSSYYNETSASALIEFYRKIATVLEIAVYPEAFLHFMTGDSTGGTHRVNNSIHDAAKMPLFIGIWIRKQEFLGFYTGKGKNYLKKFDNGLRLFVINYIRRLITYMRTYNELYPSGYEVPYNYSITDPVRIPLPYNGVYQYSAPPKNYYISRLDWMFIPNIFLPEDSQGEYKVYIEPAKWNNPPEPWWIERATAFFGYNWWTLNREQVNDISKPKIGSYEHRKWLTLNCILPQNYDTYLELWDYHDRVYDGNGGNSSYVANAVIPVKSAKAANAVKAAKSVKAAIPAIPAIPAKPTNHPIRMKFAKPNVFKEFKEFKEFKIIPDEYRTIPEHINMELKKKLTEYFKLNVIVVAKPAKAVSMQVKSNEPTESYLQNDVYIDNLIKYYRVDKKFTAKIKAATNKKQRAMSL